VNEKRPQKKAKTSVGNKHKAKTSKQTTIRKATTTTLETSDSEERTPPQKRKAPTTKAPKRQRTGASQDAQHTQILPPKGDAATEEEGGGRARQNKRKTKPKTTKEKKKKRTRNVNERRTTRTSETWTISCNQRRSQDTERQQEHRRKQRSNRTGAKIAMTQDNRHQQGGHSRGVHFTAPPPFLKKDSYSLCSRTLISLRLCVYAYMRRLWRYAYSCNKKLIGRCAMQGWLPTETWIRRPGACQAVAELRRTCVQQRDR